jgi:hypothetical protein
MLDPKRIKENQARMASARMNHESDWADIGALLLPELGHVNGQFSTPGERRTDAIFDEYAELAVEDGISVFLGLVMPNGKKWQLISLGDEELMKRQDVRRWCEMVQRRLFALRDDPESGFASAVSRSVKSLFGPGFQSTWVEIRRNDFGRPIGLSYESEHYGEIYFECDKRGRVMRIHRVMQFTAEQADIQWRAKAPPKVKAAMTANPPRLTEPFEIIHVIERNPNRIEARMDAAGMPWLSGYYSCQDNLVFEQGGYWSLPRVISRWGRPSNESYGRSRSAIVLPSVRACQIMMQDRVIAAETNTKPPLIGRDDELDEMVLDIGPYGYTPGGLDEMGNPTLRTLFEGIDASDLKELHIEARGLIDRAYYRDLLQIFREQKTHMSVTRTVEEVEEKGILLEPFSLQEGEWLSPMTSREVVLMEELGLLNPMPPAVERFFDNLGGINVKYDNPLTKMRLAGAVVGLLRTGEQVASFAQFDPSIARDFSRRYPAKKWMPELGQINGIPATWEADDDEMAAFDEREAAQAEVQQLLGALPGIAQATDSLTNAAAANVA